MIPRPYQHQHYQADLASASTLPLRQHGPAEENRQGDRTADCRTVRTWFIHLCGEYYGLIVPGHSVPGISAVPHEDNLRYFDVSIHGPSQSPYEGVSYKISLGGLTIDLQ